MDFNNSIKNNNGVGIGNFDGVHLGHLSLLSCLKEKCKENNLRPVVYTFKNHPYNVIHPENPIKLIMSESEKEKAIKEYGIEEIVSEDFCSEYAKMNPEEFVLKIIVEKLSAKLVVVGENFSFGDKGVGTPKKLTELGAKYGFEVFVVPLFVKEGVQISSTYLRTLVKDGNVEGYAELAGRLYTIPGTVEHGREVGRTLGFPTANIIQDKAYVMPKPGVYETITKIGDKKYLGVTNVGNNPTFNLNHVVVETHILDYSKDIYGKFIEVGFVRRLRGEIKFDSIDQLKEQIEQDKAKVVDHKI